MNGYLLDTNTLSYWVNARSPYHAAVESVIDDLPEKTPLVVSAVTLGEIEYGLHASGKISTAHHPEFEQFVAKWFRVVLSVTKSTASYYGPLRARLFERFGGADNKTEARRPEQLADPATGEKLGVDENDVWIAAQAIEHTLVLVTHDRLHRIRSVTKDELNLMVEDWARPPESL